MRNKKRKRYNPAYHALIPTALVSRLPELEVKCEGIVGFRPDRLKEVITLMVFLQREDEIAYMQMSILEKFVPRAHLYRDVLIEEKVIELTVNYKVGEHSNGYRFLEPYAGECEYIEIKDQALLRRISSKLNRCEASFKKNYPEYWKDLNKLSIDPQALDFIEKNYSGKKKRRAMISFLRINDRFLYAKKDDTSNRFHSPVTNMPKELRRFLRVDGVPQANIDVKTSQPYILASVMENPEKYVPYAKSNRFKRLLANINPCQGEDVHLFKFLVREGDIYQYMLEKFREAGLIHYKTRDDVKEPMMKVLFSCNYCKSGERKVFKELFPNVNRYLNVLRGPKIKKKFENHGRLAILLQTIESEAIDRCVKWIYKDQHDVVTITIYDSILTGNDPCSIETVRSTMAEEFTKVVGNPPRLKKE